MVSSSVDICFLRFPNCDAPCAQAQKTFLTSQQAACLQTMLEAKVEKVFGL
jgi:hypothetical protein